MSPWLASAPEGPDRVRVPRRAGAACAFGFRRAVVGGLVVLAGLAAPRFAPAVVFISTADPNYNTTAPTGPLAGSGWELQGRWGAFLGTPVAPNFFLTAEHIGGAVGDKFTFGGVNYVTKAFFDDPNSDLRLWQIDGTFPTYAPLYDQSDEVGKSLVVFGRGKQRGAEVTVNGTLKGWKEGTADHVQRWGENQVSAIVDGGLGIGQLLRATFDFGVGDNEAHLSTGDSGGAVFILDGGTWKLAGINYAVDGPYSTSPTETTFRASLFDQGGLYLGGASRQFIPDQDADLPSAFYATRISANLDWINAVIPEPRHYGLAVGAGLMIAAWWRRLAARAKGARGLALRRTTSGLTSRP
jgi:hypothetical protein